MKVRTTEWPHASRNSIVVELTAEEIEAFLRPSSSQVRQAFLANLLRSVQEYDVKR